ncbi:MAG: hypothetical protein MHM6MM_001071 [Cercozoa sp. M6MM]
MLCVVLALLSFVLPSVLAEKNSSYIPDQGTVSIALNQPSCLLQFFSTGLTAKDPDAVNHAPCSPWDAYPTILGVSTMALMDINDETLNPNFLPNHNLTLPRFDPKGIALVAAKEALQVVNYVNQAETLAAAGLRNESDPTQPRPMVGVIGPSYADSTSASSLIYSAADLMQVAPLVPAADLSDASKYPYLLRMRGSEQTGVVAILDLCLSVGFKRVAILHSNDLYGNSFHSSLDDAISQRGAVAEDFEVGYKAAVPLSRSLSKNSTEYADAEERMREHMRQIEKEQLRIILLYTTTGDDDLLYDIVAKDEASSGEFQDYFRSHQHLVVAPPEWPAFVGIVGKKRPATLALTPPSYMYLKDDPSLLEVELWSRPGHPKRTAYLRSKTALHAALSAPDVPFSILSTGIHFVAETAYDSVVLLALTFDELLERNRTATPGSDEAIKLAALLSDRELFGRAMQKHIGHQKFSGHSGPVEFDALLDRKPAYGVARWQANAFLTGDFQVIGSWDTDTHTIAFNTNDGGVLASDGTNQEDVARARSFVQVDYSANAVAGQPGDNGFLPQDGPGKVETLNQVKIQALGIVLGVIGIVCAVGVLVHINMKRELRYVKMGAPNIQSIQLLGLVFAFTSLLYAHMDTERFNGDSDKAEGICRAVFWTEQLSFAIVFGALLAKALRIYVIFTRNDWTVVRLSDKHLAAVVVAITSLAGIIMLVFDAGYDAIYLERKQLSVEYSDTLDANVFEFTERCKIRDDYDGVFYAVTLGFQGLLMVGGLWLANELRGVSIPALNDSAEVRQTMVLVFVIALLTKPTQLLVESDDPRSVYVLTVLSTFLLNFSALVYLFAGRVVAVLRGDHVVQTSSLASIGTGHTGTSYLSGQRGDSKGSSTEEGRSGVVAHSEKNDRHSSTTRSTHSTSAASSTSEIAGVAMATLPGETSADSHV